MYTILLTRQWSRLSCLCRFSTTVEGSKVSQNTVSNDGISPPLRIHRNPTDILEALSATVGRDPTAAHYKYHDDPYLIPLSNYRKRAYALSAEAGRRAAVWVRDNHADWFTTRVWDPPMKMITPHFNADPHIDAFAPKPIYTSESKVTEEDLKYTIQNAQVEDSIQVFQLLGGSEGVNYDLKIKFLQLLCFYNEKEGESIEWMEERWFSRNMRERHAATWRTGGLADQIFTSMEPKTPEAYCAIILGMAKYYQADRAYMLAQEAIEKGITLSTDVFNALLGCIGFLKEGTSLRTEALKETLKQMEELGISPNTETLTACLRSVSAWGGGRNLQQLAQQLLSEFRSLGIEPNLSAYYYLLCLFCKERGPRNDILSLILNDLEKRETLDALEPTDTHFFITAMGVCSDHLQSIEMAERLHKLLMKNDNYKLVGDAFKESIYYRHYVTVACRHAPLEKTIELLDTLIPNIYVPEPSVFEEIIKTLELGGLGDRLAQAWSQLLIFGHARRVKLVENLLNAMCNCYQYQDDEVKAKMRSAAVDILKFGQISEVEMEMKESRTPPPNLSAAALCNIVELCTEAPAPAPVSVSAGTEEAAAAAEWAAAAEALRRLRGEQAAGVARAPRALALAAHRAAERGEHHVAASAVAYLAECGFEEAATTSVKLLQTILNRSEEEVMTLLKEPRSNIADGLQPSAAMLLDAYHIATTGVAPMKRKEDTSSSDSDSESSSDDD